MGLYYSVDTDTILAAQVNGTCTDISLHFQLFLFQAVPPTVRTFTNQYHDYTCQFCCSSLATATNFRVLSWLISRLVQSLNCQYLLLYPSFFSVFFSVKKLLSLLVNKRVLLFRFIFYVFIAKIHVHVFKYSTLYFT